MKLKFQTRNNEGSRKRKMTCQTTTADVKNKLNHFKNITCAIISLQRRETHNLYQTFQLTSR
ncbi:hypothetical protein OIU76_005179 [Salix suchowensis]|nr:hypothetical protein OIU76_005179 [Salix suchowensis]